MKKKTTFFLKILSQLDQIKLRKLTYFYFKLPILTYVIILAGQKINLPNFTCIYLKFFFLRKILADSQRCTLYQEDLSNTILFFKCQIYLKV